MDNVKEPNDILKEILRRIEGLESTISSKTAHRPDELSLMDNAELCQLLKVDKRTTNSYRSKGLISYVTIAGKVYYRTKDILDLIEQGYTNKKPQNQADHGKDK